MTKMPGRLLGAAVCALFFAAAVAAAQAPVRVRGIIDHVDGKTLSATARDGATVQIKLTDDARVLTLDRKTLADVKQGSFVGITAMPQPDGMQKAVEIHIFPEAMRGTGEGHYSWDLMPNSTMTNGSIDNQVVGNDGQTLVMKYKDGEKTVIVPANAEVVMFVAATLADIKAGQKFFVPRGKRLPDGAVESGSIVIGSRGVDPPM